MKKRKSEKAPAHGAPPKTQMSRDELRHVTNRKRQKKRKRIRLFVYVLLLFCFAGTAVALSLTVFFRIGTVTVTGSSMYDAADIENAAGIHTGDNLFLTDTSAAARKITGTLPYAGKAVITRKLPDTLLIKITDTAECAAIDCEAGYVLIDETGKVINAGTPDIRDGIAYVTGVTPSEAVLCKNIAFTDSTAGNALITVLKALKSADLTKITKISLDDLNAVTLVYDDRITLKAGGLSNIDKKLQRAAKAIADEEARNKSVRGTLDLTIDPYAYFRETKKSTG